MMIVCEMSRSAARSRDRKQHRPRIILTGSWSWTWSCHAWSECSSAFFHNWEFK